MTYVESPVIISTTTGILSLDAASVTAPGGSSVIREGVFVGDAANGSQTLCVTSAGMLLNTGGLLNATGQVPISLTATQIIAANARQGLLITNPSTVTVFVGGSGVTAATGQELLAGQSLSLPVTSAVYGIVSTGTQTVSYLKVV
jgi:hypothetical protein